MEFLDLFSIVGSVASIIGLIVGIAGTSAYYKFTDNSSNKVSVKDVDIGGDFTGRDKNA